MTHSAKNAHDANAGIESCIRTIEKAQPGKEREVFKLQAGDAMKLARDYDFEKTEVIARLRSAALSKGIPYDAAEAVLSAATEPVQAVPTRDTCRSLEEAMAEPVKTRSANAGETHASEPQIRRGRVIPIIPFGENQLGTERRQLVKDLIPRAGLCVVWGPPKCGKSFWVFDLVMHIALGRPYRGRRVLAGPVVYGAFEGAHGFSARIEAFRQKFLLETAEPIPFYLEPLTLNLVREHRELIAAIKAALGDTIPVVIVLDTLNRSLEGSESNDKDMAAYIRAVDALREAFDCAVLIVHHCGIDGTRPRGHTSLTGAVDAQLGVKRNGTGNIEVKVEYMKDGPEGSVIASRLDEVIVGKDEDGEAITSCVVVPVDGAAAVSTAKKSMHLPKGAQTALRALREAVSECGCVPPASSHIPAGARVVTTDKWRDYAYRLGISTSPEDRAKQQAFKRAFEYLIRGGYVRVLDNQVWLIG